MSDSRVMTMARAEGDEAEADDEEEESEEEEPEATPSAEPEPEQLAQPFAQVGPAEIKKAERAIEAQRERLGKIFGPEAVAHECILCAGMGFLPDVPPAGIRFEVVFTDDGPALVALEPEPEKVLKYAPDKQMCDWCDGEGKTLTYAKAEHSKVGPCGKCQGNGWVTVAVDAGQVTPQPMTLAPAPPTATGQAEPMPNDAWGRPYGHQHWGVPPAQIPG